MRKLLLTVIVKSVLALNLSAAGQGLPVGPAVHLAGLQNPAQIVRDTNDIPHITAHNDHDIFFLQGYVHAEDRLFQMDVSRRRASGTLAELVGGPTFPGHPSP